MGKFGKFKFCNVVKGFHTLKAHNDMVCLINTTV